LALKKKRYDLNRIFAKYNLENTIILLEGKRNVIESIKNLSFWSSWQQTYLKANGNADGAFLFLSRSFASGSRTFTSYYAYDHRQTNNAYETISLDQIDLLTNLRWSINLKATKKTKLIDKYVGGAKGPFCHKAAYIMIQLK
jgi:hypothetical protein